jgi:prepilin-type N-terminal cleavage/methylation domain-containing protein
MTMKDVENGRPRLIGTTRREGGYSVLELMMVLVIIGVMAAFSVMALRPSKNAYMPDTAASVVLSFLREASARALAERRTIRVEIYFAADQRHHIRMIDQNTLTPPAAEFTVRDEALPKPADVSMAVPTPGGTPITPPPAPYSFTAAAIPTTTVGTPWAIRFSSFGSACDATLQPLSATIYLFTPTSVGGTTPTTVDGVRAITVAGSGGSTRFWKYRTGSGFVSNAR